ncbi:cation diffusion facilitator family transporter [Lysinibacillus fusiformis]|uniref:cation diffusion facilitator family transporter n=1 Tax=Lysinibacillus fusiformis TaxID=28031 RepID=UPI0036624CE0
MSKENMNLFLEDIDVEGTLDFDELESKLEHEIELHMSDLHLLKEEQKKIGNEDNLGEIIKGVVWEQFMNQIAAKAGTDFIGENHGLTLDLRKDAHIQTTENFEKGKIATHNKQTIKVEINGKIQEETLDYQKRYDNYQARFQKDENGNVKTRIDSRTGKEIKVLNKDARDDFDKGRDKGSASVHKDHTIPTAEINRDAAANAHLSREEQVAFANSDKNLNDLDSAANQSKGDSSMKDWLNSERDGKKPEERFNVNGDELREQDKVSHEEYEKRKKEGEQRSIEAGKQSRKEEAFRIGGKALRSAIMLLFAEFTKEVISKLVKWLKSAQKSLKTLMEYIKEAVKSFISNLKLHLKNASNNVLTTIMTAIVGPIFETIKKVWILLKQGWKSLKEAVNYLKNPDNKDQPPLSIRLLETGKIVMAGLSAVSAIVLGEIIEKSLMTIPFLAVEIPLLGSLANLIGLFAGGLTAGIIGAIAINIINKAVEKKQKEINLSEQIEKSNEILDTQAQLIMVSEEKFSNKKNSVRDSIAKRHAMAQDELENSLKNIFSEGEANSKNNDDSFDEMDQIIKGLLD